MKQNINEELNYMKYLFGYKKGVVISEQEIIYEDPTTPATPTKQGGDGCIPLTISGKFNPKKADSTEYLTNIIAELDKQIKGKPEFQGGTVTSMKIIGGASNVDNGVKSDFTLNNDYTPSGVTPKQTKEFQKNMGYAQARIDAAKQPILDELQKAGLTVSVEPTTEAHVIDTGGTGDANRNKETHPKEGQVVIVQMTICPVKQESSREGGGDGQTTTSITQITQIIPEVVECFTGVVVKVNFDQNAEDQSHACEKAVWSITANDIEIFRTNKTGTKVSYASLNNVFDNYDDAEVRAPKNGKEKGGYRFNTFTIDEITAKQFANLGSVQKYQGDLQIQMTCEIGANGKLKSIEGHRTSSGGCHRGTVYVEVISKEVTESTIVRNAPVKSGQKADVYKVPACKAVYQKLAPELQKFEIPKENPDVRDPKAVDYMRQSLSVGGNK